MVLIMERAKSGGVRGIGGTEGWIGYEISFARVMWMGIN